jgi:ribose-phosphate pyrophosphokinase
VAGDPIAIDVLARVLASTGVRSFATVDAHSEAAARAFAASGCTFENLAAAPWLQRYLDGVTGAGSARRPTWFVAPDKGARLRTAAAAAAASTRERPVGVVHCLKVRDAATGALQGFRVDDADSPRDLGRDPLVVIVDDICDGGGTFLGVAKALRTAYGDVPLHLWTTHAILSKGTAALAATFATLGATDSFRHGHTHERLRIVPLRT